MRGWSFGASAGAPSPSARTGSRRRPPGCGSAPPPAGCARRPWGSPSTAPTAAFAAACACRRGGAVPAAARGGAAPARGASRGGRSADGATRRPPAAQVTCPGARAVARSGGHRRHPTRITLPGRGTPPAPQPSTCLGGTPQERGRTLDGWAVERFAVHLPADACRGTHWSHSRIAAPTTPRNRRAPSRDGSRTIARTSTPHARAASTARRTLRPVVPPPTIRLGDTGDEGHGAARRRSGRCQEPGAGARSAPPGKPLASPPLGDVASGGRRPGAQRRRRSTVVSLRPARRCRAPTRRGGARPRGG